MNAMILAAGRGERMRPLTDSLPKPLLPVKGKTLIEWHIEKLAKNGFEEIIINIAHLGYKIEEYVKDGSQWGVKIYYSDEQGTGALESAGGIKKALPLLGDEPFLVVNGDIFCDYEFNPDFELQGKLAHLILVPNPPHNPKGDFGLKNGHVTNKDDDMYTFSGIGYYHPNFFKDVALQKSSLTPILRDFIDKKFVSGEVFNKMWHDIGTPKRLQEINEN
ncbi:N-acetylmuramate alpha-1-phosphate uridylyltransferase MurU [Sulfurimonas autotrophica]|uniref:Nucleotidyl transferase n=1 Tax=Sulfurimonas autotrophica (strain ATCC BAA-671 / DSM 16294 / JCM 11897 / OK10) TaxID=563040 RepID=E0URI0_SULAO|nr:nucleotidyltransferase family protein [Sulfurimonas autotrophica]ADN10066.1 Nucleotidyl transferase [Sulfurimonas autotrophica DSM 16294]